MPAPNREDPREVVTPLDADALEATLREQGIFGKWGHVIDRIRHGFDVGVKSLVSHTTVHSNHTSSALDPNFISSYTQSEITNSRYTHSPNSRS